MAESKITKVMKEFKAGDLKTGSGKKVTSPKQAMAIAISEQKEAKKMAEGGIIPEPKTVARGSGAARTQYFRKNG
jgi:hypothetical protein|tara:strand:+ start:52 stop:276 length:225 start_codon:yes stop_codon:yes gene_type:complete